MKTIPFYLLISSVVCSQQLTAQTSKEDRHYQEAYQSITAQDLKNDLLVLASDEMEGRKTGTSGQKKAAEYLVNEYKKMEISYPKGLSSYYQNIPMEALISKKLMLQASENVLAFIPGSDKPDEVVVLSAHYDHLGTSGDIIYNGADDNGSGTVAILEIAEAFQKAKKMGTSPRRSILFLHVTGEEFGLLGSKYYTEHPVFPLEKTMVNINIDMIGRVDEAHKTQPNYVYVIGSDMLSSDLKSINESNNARTHQMALDYKYDDPKDPMRLYYRSDHYSFAKHGIPAMFYFDGIHEDYHLPTDDADRIDYDLLAKRTQLIFSTVWELANRPQNLVEDKASSARLSQ